MKNQKKKNNKGFSLVELIVVVMIMAILAVALAPQVMKWVGNSRIAADRASYDSLVSACNMALADSTTVKDIGAITLTVTVGTSNTTVATTATGTAATTAVTALQTKLAEILPSYTTIVRKDTTSTGVADYVITVSSTSVAKTTPPVGSIDE